MTVRHFPAFFFFLSALFVSCAPWEQPAAATTIEVNLEHLNYLYEDRVLPTLDTIGFLYRTSRPPLYERSGIDGEGIASVDDAARAAVVYLRHYRRTGRDSSLLRGRRLLRFLLYMQNDNGYFHNYLHADGNINDTTLFSIAAPGSWSWRALWALGEGIGHLPENDPLYGDLTQGRDLLLWAIRTDLPDTDTTMRFGGLQLPAWLPRENDANQAALLMLGLIHHHRQTGSTTSRNTLERLAEGILMTQVDNEGAFPTGAFLSYRNIWRAAHHLQGYALMTAAEALDRPDFTRAALRELDLYFPRLLEKGFAGQWIFEKNALDTFDVVQEAMFPQTPADFRPIIWAAVKGYQMTDDQRFLDMARSYARWFFGDNAAGSQFYDPSTGRGFAGLNVRGRPVDEASAAATLEGLLAMQAIAYPMVPF